MTTAHTPGEWIINRDSKDCGDDKLSIEVAGDYFIAQVDPGVCQEANARLISAAPELLEAMKKRVEEEGQRVFEDWLDRNRPSGDADDVNRQWLESSDYTDFWIEWSVEYAAISKATGESQ